MSEILQYSMLPFSQTELMEYKIKVAKQGVVIYAFSDSIIGAIAFYANERQTLTAYITQISVAEYARGKSVGQKLLDSCFAYCASLGFRQILLEVANNNIIAKSLYEKNGFHFKSKASEKTSYWIKTIQSVSVSGTSTSICRK